MALLSYNGLEMSDLMMVIWMSEGEARIALIFAAGRIKLMTVGLDNRPLF